jgi:hypothetical protein
MSYLHMPRGTGLAACKYNFEHELWSHRMYLHQAHATVIFAGYMVEARDVSMNSSGEAELLLLVTFNSKAVAQLVDPSS